MNPEISDCKKENNFHNFGDFVYYPCEHALVCLSADFDGVYYFTEAGLCKHDACRGLCDICCCVYCRAELSLFKCRGVVHTVSGHAYHVALFLHEVDNFEFVFRIHFCKTVAVVNQLYLFIMAQAVKLIRTVDTCPNADISGDFLSYSRVVAGKHDSPNAEFLNLPYHCL